ncbi:HK97 family phage prohead protease [Aureimonas altamirensis]|uniref:HK97 family phage prohead protease n=1 Tax=Aureimonas altamirensis TaxID=370622 RepID=UPI0020367A63|nr:HK97 family phage prohead protease [Aureimonas altamirensis]MCM2504089.1 HK97 family phage prohead protease [Aureimonas altamirensis]
MNLIETKAEITSTETGEISGLAWPFGTPDRAGDMIQKGAFSSASLPLPMLSRHDPAAPVGVWTGVEETDEGLILKGRLLLDEVAGARETLALVKAGVMRGLSIGFRTLATGTPTRGRRLITKAELVECSFVTVPSHPGAKVLSTKDGTRALALADAINRATLALSPKK